MDTGPITIHVEANRSRSRVEIEAGLKGNEADVCDGTRRAKFLQGANGTQGAR